jgi:hypothetical protein
MRFRCRGFGESDGGGMCFMVPSEGMTSVKDGGEECMDRFIHQSERGDGGLMIDIVMEESTYPFQSNTVPLAKERHVDRPR